MCANNWPVKWINSVKQEIRRESGFEMKINQSQHPGLYFTNQRAQEAGNIGQQQMQEDHVTSCKESKSISQTNRQK
jgi:hypothetical protein